MMRRWMALIAGFATVTLAGTALALTSWTAPAEEPESLQVAGPVATAAKATPTTEAKRTTTTTTKPERTETTKPERTETTKPADTTPPRLAILHPVDGQVFHTKEVVFEGKTEPGAKVFAGRYEADVREDGSWRIVLFLSPGRNKATFTAIDEARNKTTASVVVVLERKDRPDERPDWKFRAVQVYGSCSENPPYDVFHGTGKPGSTIHVRSEYGHGTTTVNERGKWEIKVFFENAPVGKPFKVKVKDEFGHYEMFRFVHTEG